MPIGKLCTKYLWTSMISSNRDACMSPYVLSVIEMRSPNCVNGYFKAATILRASVKDQGEL